MGHLQHAAKSTCASLKVSFTRVGLRRHKSLTHPGTSSSSQRKSTSSSADSSPSFPGCTCPSFYSKSKESASICQVHPNLHHLRQPTLLHAVKFGRRRIDKSV